MTMINIVFDDVYNDVDIIAVPDEIVFKIEQIGQKFLDWVPTSDDSEYYSIVNGRRVVVVETDGFIKWLNLNYCIDTEKRMLLNVIQITDLNTEVSNSDMNGIYKKPQVFACGLIVYLIISLRRKL